MSQVVCPECGDPNSELNFHCRSCGAPLPMSSTAHTESSSGSSANVGMMLREEPLVGRTIEGYRVEELLGRGGMGEVYRAWDERQDRPVALKLIRPDRLSDTELHKRFRREARAVSALDHPAIVKIYDALESDQGEVIVMELVEGASFGELFKEQPLDIDRLLELTREVAEGLAAAHARGFVHRDLKGENIRVTPEGDAKILDFGLAKQFARGDRDAGLTEPSLTQVGGVVGTFRAMSPEQAQGFPVDHRSDLFSLGTLLYETVTGLSPFRRSNLALTLFELCNHRQRPARELNPDVPEALSRLIDHLLAKAPAERPESAGAVAQELGRIRQELGRP